MKKFSVLLFSLIIALCLISCGKKSDTFLDQDGCFFDIDAAMDYAQKNNQRMLIIFTVEGDDAFSEQFMNSVVRTDEFKETILKNYTVVHMDFSDSTYQKAIVVAADSKNKQQQATKKALQLQKNNSFADMLKPEATPSFFLMTKDEYYISELYVPETVLTVQDFQKAIDAVNPVAEDLESLVEKLKSGTNMEKIAVIDEIYEATYPTYRTFLADLIEQVIKLDKNNESGLLSKYLMADAENSALAYFYINDIESSINAYINLCSNQYLAPKDKQQCYYMAAYLMSYTGSDDLSQIIQYLQYAIQSYPEGENVPAIQNVLDYIAASYNAGAAQ